MLTSLSYSIPVKLMIFPIDCANDDKLRVLLFSGNQWEKAINTFSEK